MEAPLRGERRERWSTAEPGPASLLPFPIPMYCRNVKTTTVFFPFDLFGSAGSADGVRLLADAFAEMLADNRLEKKPTRAVAYQGRVQNRELKFETLADYQNWRERGRKAVRQVFDRGRFLCWVAGNHL